MVRIDLEPEPARQLSNLLHVQLDELRHEIAHTERRPYRRELLQTQEFLERFVATLDGQLARTEEPAIEPPDLLGLA